MTNSTITRKIQHRTPAKCLDVIYKHFPEKKIRRKKLIKLLDGLKLVYA